MSVWLTLQNELKRRSPEQYLTPTQRDARDQMLDLMRFPQWINLYGEYGTGKTFLAWALARATGAIHIPASSQLKDRAPSSESLLIDNAPHDQSTVRRFLATCDLLGAPSVVLITRHPVTMPMHRVELPLPSPNDVDLVIKSLGLLNYPCNRAILPPSPNFWNILQACI